MNKTYSSWAIISEPFKIPDKRGYFVKCICECGTVANVNYQNILSGKSKKCGILGRHKSPHSREKHRLYSTWKSIKSRCYNPNTSSYKYYGGRGIEMCDDWKHDFYKFVEDMYPSFIEGLTLDRRDNNGHYNKLNCRWATSEEQATNQRKSLKLEYNGKYYTESQLSKEFNVKRTTIQQRRRNGWTVEEMIYGRNNVKQV